MIEQLIHKQTPKNIEGYHSKNIDLSNGTLLGFIQICVINFSKVLNRKTSVFFFTEMYGNKKGCQSKKMYTTNDTQWVLTLKLSQILIRQTRDKHPRSTNFLNYIPMN